MKSVYKKYMSRLIEISGRSRSLLLRNVTKKYSYDIGRLLEQNAQLTEQLIDCLWQRKRKPFKLITEDTRKLLTPLYPAGTLPSDAAAKEISSITYLKREIDEIEKETGRYELFVGYPFLRGYLNRDTPVRAPLFLFPARINIDGKEVEIEFNYRDPVLFNKALILAYGKEYGMDTDEIAQEFDDMSDSNVSTVENAINYLKSKGFKIKAPKRADVCPFDAEEIKYGETLETVNYCILGRFPLASSIYNDYLVMARENRSSPAIDALIGNKTAKLPKNVDDSEYYINRLDFSQENAIKKINKGQNLVLYGPPGTGKSQTIVNVVSDAICKGKKVLVVSQKRAALDVVYNRLGTLNKKAMLLLDPEKNKSEFYKIAMAAHNGLAGQTPGCEKLKYEDSVSSLKDEVSELMSISDLMFSPAKFGISLQQMYAQSKRLGHDSQDYKIYEQMLNNKTIIKQDYASLFGAMRVIREKNKGAHYIDYIEAKKENPLVTHLIPGLDIHKLNEAQSFLQKALLKAVVPFDTASLPHSRYILTYYLMHKDNNKYALGQFANMIAKIEDPPFAKLYTASLIPPMWPLLLFTYPKMREKRKAILRDFDAAIAALRTYVEDYSLLKLVLDDEGFAMTLDAIANGNNAYLKKLLAALKDYIPLRDMQNNLGNLSPLETAIMDFALSISKNRKTFLETLDKILPIRIYHEVITEEKLRKEEFGKLLTFNDLRERVLSLKKEQRHMVREMATEMAGTEYLEFLKKEPEAGKNFVHQLSKQRAQWPVRRTMEYFDKFLLKLFPCWLLSPDAVSSILPLKKDMFDLVLFDEASQVYIESTIPTIYRGKNIVVAGDNKQLRPTASFVKRYLGADEFNVNVPLSEQAALEVESLLDLATSRFEPATLTYHYRSNYEELINFSNYAFYNGKLQISPNTQKASQKPPIERIMVKGSWAERHNAEEGAAIVDLVKRIFKTREKSETIGIVTFNIEQKEYIEDLLEAECLKNAAFKRQYFTERNRIENGEDLSLFVKNLENVQGDERDIIIFSIGYARNESDKVFAHFGSLSVEGGENRLNVAITRAKDKIYVVTSVEPEELNVDNSKNAGPKLLKRYLQYARAVSAGDHASIKAVLTSLYDKKEQRENLGAFESQIKAALTKLGYKVDTLLGDAAYKISLGIYDEEAREYVLGIECDYAAYESSSSVLERDVYRPKFLESRGWKIMRIWSRDWWMNEDKVIAAIERAVKLKKKKPEILALTAPVIAQ